MMTALSHWTKGVADAIKENKLRNHTVATWEGSQVQKPHPLRQGGYSMDMVHPARWAQLVKRRSEITMTLRHVERERQDIAAMEQSMDPKARASRLVLLRDLSDWYSQEYRQLDQILRQVEQDH